GSAGRGPALTGGWTPLGTNALVPAGTLLAGQAEQTVIHEMLPLVTSLYVTHLMTDRPLYRPGETVYFRSLTLERFSLKPAEIDLELHFELRGKDGQVVHDPATGQPLKLTGQAQLKDKDGKPALGPDGKAIRGVGAGAFQLPPSAAGGEYALVVRDSAN